MHLSLGYHALITWLSYTANLADHAMTTQPPCTGHVTDHNRRRRGCGVPAVRSSHPCCLNFLPSPALLASSGETLGAGRAGLQSWKPAAPSRLHSACQTLGQLLKWGQPGISVLFRGLPPWGLSGLWGNAFGLICRGVWAGGRAAGKQ